jgi:hypothetical protein
MTDTPADTGLAPEAAARLDAYLVQVREALAGAADVNPDEIDADIREHVENELRAVPRPVPLAALEAVLTKLGPPAQWGAAPDPTTFRRARHLLSEGLRSARAAAAERAKRMRTAAAERAKRVRIALWNGPEDWRLAYLSFGVFALGALTVFVFPIALLVSYVLSRAGLAVAKEKGIDLGAGRKWLLYPPVVLVSASLLSVVVAWPVVLGVMTFEEVNNSRARIARLYAPTPLPNRHTDLSPDAPVWREYPKLETDRALLAAVPVAPEFAPVAAGLFVGFGAVMLWWTVIGFVGAAFPGAVRAAFVPLCDRFERHHGSWLGFTCLAVSVGWCVAAWNYASAAGLM